MRGLFAAASLAVACVSNTATAEAPVIDSPVFKSLPETRSFTIYAPTRTEDDYEGAIDLICRIRDHSGRLLCQVTGMSPINAEWGNTVRRSMNAAARIDMAKTPGARIGRLVHIILRIELA